MILVISLLVYAPSWAHGPRYRPGQPWDSNSEWFGTPVAAGVSPELLDSRSADGLPPADEAGSSASQDPDEVRRPRPGSGGASADW